MKYPVNSILTTSEKLPKPSNKAAWLAWSHEMKGLLVMVANLTAMKPAFKHDPSEVADGTSYGQFDINWDSPFDVVQAGCCTEYDRCLDCAGVEGAC